MRSPDSSSSDAPSAAVRTIRPALGELEALADRLQTVALLVLEPSGDADPVAIGCVDQEAPGQRDLRRETGALRPHRILHRLDEDLLAPRDELLNALAVPLPLQLGDDDLVHVQEAVAVEADVDEGRLHSGEDVVDDTLVDVSGDRAVRGAFEVDLDDLAVLEHRNRLLEHLDGDQDLLGDVRQRDPRRLGRLAGGRAPALALRLVLRLAPSAVCSLLRPRRLLCLRGRSLRLGLDGGRLGLLLAATPAAASAAPARRLSFGLSGVLPGRLLSLGRLGSGRLDGRLLPALLPAKPSHVRGLLSGARRARRRWKARQAAGCLPQISYGFRAGACLPRGLDSPCASVIRIAAGS